jgi:hypothetical protein
MKHFNRAKNLVFALMSVAVVAGMPMSSDAKPQRKLQRHNALPQNYPYLSLSLTLDRLTQVGMQTSHTGGFPMAFMAGPGPVMLSPVSYTYKDHALVSNSLTKDLEGTAVLTGAFGRGFKCVFNLRRPELNQPCNIPTRQEVEVVTYFTRVAPRSTPVTVGNTVKISGAVELPKMDLPTWNQARNAANAAASRDMAESSRALEEFYGGGSCRRVVASAFSGGCGVRSPFAR